MLMKCEYCKNKDGKTCEDCKAFNSSNGRDQVIKRLASNYGIKYSSKILNIVRASEKVLFKDLCRVYNVSPSMANLVTTNDMLADCLENHLPANELLAKMSMVINDAEFHFGEVLQHLDYVYNCANMIYGASIHASGTILSEEPINIANNEGVCHANGHYCEELGYIKFDLLSLSNLDAIETLKGLDIDWDNVDRRTLDYICEGNLDFVFQFGSPVVDEMIHGVKPEEIGILSLSEITSINRPGPLGINLNRIWVDSKNGELPMQDLVTENIKYLKGKGLLKI